MINRRIWVSVAVTVRQLSITMARPELSCKAHRRASFWTKKRAVKLGGPHRPFPSDGGGRFPPEGSRKGAGLHPPPWKEPSAGATMAGDTLHCSNLVFDLALNLSRSAPRQSARTHRS